MSDTNGATAPAADAEPSITLNGQQWTPSMAAARRAELMGNIEYAKAALGGDEEKQAELRDLYMVARGMTPASSQPPATADDVIKGMTEREKSIEMQREANLRDRVAPVTRQELEQYERNEATVSEKAAAKRFIEMAKRDPGFRTKLLGGDIETNLKWSRWHYIRDSAVEISDPEIAANG